MKITKQSFRAGVLSPTYTAEIDSELYAMGMYRLDNFMPALPIGIKNCPGTQYIADAYDTTEQSRLIPFQFNEEQAYVLEFGDSKMRIVKDGGLVESGGSPVEVVSPYPIADVDALDYTQSADTLFAFHGDYNIRKVTRTSDIAWSFTDIGTIDGPYIPRESGDDDTTITISLFSGTTWDFVSNTAIFGDVEVNDCIRLGFRVPGDAAALWWTWYKVISVTDSSNIRATLQEETRPVYQQILNPEFEKGLTYWQEITTLASTGSLTYDSTNQRAVLTYDGTNDAKMEQAVLTFSNVNHRIVLNIAALTGATPRVTLKVGTSSGAGDIYTSAVMTAIGPYTYTIRPTAETIYVSFDTVGSTAADIIEIDKVELFESGDDPAAGSSYSTTDWSLGAWGAIKGYPKHGLILGNQMVCANTASYPNTVWVSELGDFEGFGESNPIRSTDSFSVRPSTGQINGIKWLLEKDGLKAGTAGAIWRIIAPSTGVLSPTDVAIEVDESEGSLDLKPIVAHNAILITPRGESPVLELVSSLEAKGFNTSDIASHAEHLFRNRRIVKWAFAKAPDSVVWCILDDGTMLGMVYHRRLGFTAWFKRTCPLGAGYADVVVIPNSSDDNLDDVYLLVNRGTVQSPNYYIEQMNMRITPQTAAYGLSASGSPYDYRFLDSALTLDSPVTISGATQADPVVITATAHGFSDGDKVRIQNVIGMTELNNNVYKVANKTANDFELNDKDDNNIDGTGFTAYVSGGESRKMVTTISGLGHLEGKTVTAIADGTARENLTVSSGNITLPQSASFAHIGVPRDSEAETLDIEAITRTGTTQGSQKAIKEVDIYFRESRDLKVYTSNRTDKERQIQFEGESFGENPPDLFDGIKTVDIQSDHDKQVRLVFKQYKPYPVHIQRALVDVDFAG